MSIELFICVLCGEAVGGVLYDARPVSSGLCCELCHEGVVVPERRRAA